MSVPDLELGFATLGCSGALVDEVARVAERHRITGVELRVAADEFVHQGLTDAAAEAVGRRLRDSGIRTIALSGYVRLCDEDEGVVPDLVRDLELARAIGATGVRTFMRDPHPSDTAPSTVGGFSDGELRALDRLAEADLTARETGVAILIETHDTHTRADQLAPFMTELDRQAPGSRVRVLWDTAHSWSHEESLVDSWELLQPWLGHLQVKDERSLDDPVPVMLGEGSFPVAELMSLLAEKGYAGLLSLEWERKWHPGLPDIDTALAALPGWLGLSR